MIFVFNGYFLVFRWTEFGILGVFGSSKKLPRVLFVASFKPHVMKPAWRHGLKSLYYLNDCRKIYDFGIFKHY